MPLAVFLLLCTPEGSDPRSGSQVRDAWNLRETLDPQKGEGCHKPATAAHSSQDTELCPALVTLPGSPDLPRRHLAQVTSISMQKNPEVVSSHTDALMSLCHLIQLGSTATRLQDICRTLRECQDTAMARPSSSVTVLSDHTRSLHLLRPPLWDRNSGSSSFPKILHPKVPAPHP